MSTGVDGSDLVALDHSIQGLSIDGEHARCGLLVSTRVLEDTSDVSTFDLRQCYPFFPVRSIGSSIAHPHQVFN